MLPSGASGAPPSLATELPPEPVWVAIDRGLLRKALDNLVRNAVQALAQAGRTEGHVIVAVARRPDGGATLEVRDDGRGVPEAERDRVFDAYFTTKSEGTGLGLAITKKIVLEHGGSIECAAALEGGAAFRVMLPPARPSLPVRGAEASEPSADMRDAPPDTREAPSSERPS
jgi:signal transduction histidine kinase